MRLQRRFTQRLTIGVTPEQSEQLQLLANKFETDVSTIVREWIKSGLIDVGMSAPPRLNGHAEHREVV
jgi:predicted DNA-binding protein